MPDLLLLELNCSILSDHFSVKSHWILLSNPELLEDIRKKGTVSYKYQLVVVF